MSGVFVMLAERSFYAPGLWCAVVNCGELAIYGHGRPKLIISRDLCQIVDVMPKTVVVALIGRRLGRLVAPELLDAVPGACDATILGMEDRQNYARDLHLYDQGPMTTFRTTPIDVRRASVDLVLRCSKLGGCRNKCGKCCQDAEAQAEAALIASISKGS